MAIYKCLHDGRSKLVDYKLSTAIVCCSTSGFVHIYYKDNFFSNQVYTRLYYCSIKNMNNKRIKLLRIRVTLFKLFYFAVGKIVNAILGGRMD